MSLAEISRVEKMYESSKKTGDYARELECLAALRLLYVREGDRAGEAKRITRIWKQRLEEIIKTKIKSLSLDQRRTYINDLRNCYKFEAEYLFESFLIFMEWKRAKQDRFYEPRKGFLKPIVDSMQRLADGELDILGISLPPRCGKMQPLDSGILTPGGWVKMRDIHIGSLVVGYDGKPCAVTGVFPQGEKEVYRVVFDDNTSVKCGGEHLWTVQTRDDRKNGTERTVTTEHMIKNLYVENGTRKNYSVKYVEPVEFTDTLSKKDLHPYIVGALIGDGCLTSGVAITTPDDAVVNKISKLLPDGDKICKKFKGAKIDYSITKIDRTRHNCDGTIAKTEVQKKLGDYGLLGLRSYEKFIPASYLYANVANRVELLRGLMDTDGYCRSDRSSYCEYTTTSKRLSENFVELVRSLGGRATCSAKNGRYKKDGEIHECRPYYRIVFNIGINPFSLPRKSASFRPRTKRAVKYISEIKKTGSSECQCIMVDSPKHLYVTDGYNLTHNTTLGLLYILWTAGRFPNESVFGSGHSTALMASFYDGTLDFATSDSYTYREIFPNGQLQAPHAKDLMLDFGTPSRYKTISFRSIDQKMSGFIEATSLLYVDDLIEDIEQALKPERLLNAYMKYEVDIKQRMANSHVPILMIGTRWSNNDPIGVEERANEDNPRAKFYAVPALNEDGESNFDFPYRGFDTNYYAQKKEAMDMIDPAIFSTVYQQTPIESEGICFHANEMNRYNGELPTDSAISTMAYIDVAWGGGDSLSMPIARTFDYGGEQRSYIIDWIFTREMKDVSLRLVVQAIIENKVQRVRVEANNGGDEYAQDLDRELRKVNYHCEITWGKASTQQSKVAKIQQYAPDIKRSFYFLYDKAMNQQYRRAFIETTSWMVTGKSPHDDAPDSLAGLCELIFGKRIGILTAIDRPRFF